MHYRAMDAGQYALRAGRHRWCENHLACHDMSLAVVKVVIPCVLRRESRPVRKLGPRCGLAIARNQDGTGEEPRRRFPRRMARHIVQKGDGA